MDIFTDKNSGMQFCMKSNNSNTNDFSKNGINDYGLIDWCKQFVTSEGSFIDIGAHIGTYSIILSKCCKTVYSFEPQKAILDCLTVGLCINNSYNINYENIALGNKESTMKLYISSDDSLFSSLRPEIYHAMNLPILRTEEVKIKTLDSYGFNKIDFIKINTEGYELEVIKGAGLTLINNNFPPIIFKSRLDDWYKKDHDLLISFIKNMGYSVYPVSGFNDIFLASDHPFRKNKQDVVSDIPEYDIEDLCKKYEDGKYNEITFFNLNTQNKIPKNTPEEIQENILKNTSGETSNEKNNEEKYNCANDWQLWHSLAKHYRLESKHQYSYDCAHRGLKLVPPNNKEYLFYEEISISAFYIDKKDEGYDACEKVILSFYTPWSTRNSTLSNEGFYMNKLQIKKKIPIMLIDKTPEKYTPSSSSIIKMNDGYLINLRTVNYYLSDKGYGISRHGDNIIRTINFLLYTDNNFTVRNSVELKDNSCLELYPKHIIGMEDVRLFGDKYFLCTRVDVNISSIPQICWGTYDNDGSVTRLVPLIAGTQLKCEKNWLPFIDNNKIYIIYATGPLQIYKLDVDSGSIHEIRRGSFDKYYINDFRGSASPIEYNDGWLCTIHQVYHSEPRKYFHRFVWFDKNFSIIKFSLPFFFDSISVEFNLSICHSHEGLLMTYSNYDSYSMMCIVDYDILNSMLKEYSSDLIDDKC